MNVVDSSGWLEYFADGPGAAFFAPAIEATDRLLVPAICIAEVFKRVLQQRGCYVAMPTMATSNQMFDRVRAGRIKDLGEGK